MAEHTPGPWKTVKPGHGHPAEYLSVQIGADEMYSTLEMLPADARLVAAAPDLLRALKDMVADAEAYYDPEDDAMKMLVAKAKAAIRKAERGK